MLEYRQGLCDAWRKAREHTALNSGVLPNAGRPVDPRDRTNEQPNRAFQHGTEVTWPAYCNTLLASGAIT